MDEILLALAPYVLWAVGVGGLVYPWRFWKTSRQRFVELYACVVIGVAVGFLTDWGVEGFRNGLVIGAIAVPALERARRDNSPVRTEVDSQHEGLQGEDANGRTEQDEEAGDSG